MLAEINIWFILYSRLFKKSLRNTINDSWRDSITRITDGILCQEMLFFSNFFSCNFFSKGKERSPHSKEGEKSMDIFMLLYKTTVWKENFMNWAGTTVLEEFYWVVPSNCIALQGKKNFPTNSLSLWNGPLQDSRFPLLRGGLAQRPWAIEAGGVSLRWSKNPMF